MTTTPVHLREHGPGTTTSGFIIAVYIAAIYLPSSLTGRYGPTKIVTASGVIPLSAAVLAAAAPADSIVILTLALAFALLGLGWNRRLIAGTALITPPFPWPPAPRP